MRNANLYLDLIAAAARQDAEQPFLITPGRESVPYHALDARCAAMHARLLAFGVEPGDRVMVQVDKSPEAVLLYLACVRAGLVYIPLNSTYTTAELDYFLNDAQPSLVICAPDRLQAVRALAERAGVPHVSTLGADADDDLLRDIPAQGPAPALRDGIDLAAIVYTSGTTGRAKGAMLSHDNLRHNATALHHCWRWDDRNDVLLHALPIFHVHGLFVALHCALLGGSPVHLLPRFDVDQVLDRLTQSTVMMGVPTYYSRLLDAPALDSDQCRHMRLFIAGSAPLPAALHHAFAARTGHRILERYGMTETGMITSNPYDGERRPGSVGCALPGVSLRVVDADGTTLPADAVGVLEVKGPSVTRGYWRQPQKTAAAFRDGDWFITGDLARLDDEGRVTLEGRADDLIISGGYNLYPKEIEAVIDAVAGVRESAVIGIADDDLGERAIAIVAIDDVHPAATAAIAQALQQGLARYKRPREIHLVRELPRNSMGKVQKSSLRTRYRRPQD